MDPLCYSYETMRPQLFNDEGQRLFLKVRDHVGVVVKRTGAIRLREAIAGLQGEEWERIACVDRMVEIGELVEIAPGRFSGDRRIFALPE